MYISELVISSTDGFASVPPHACKSQCITFLCPSSCLLGHHFTTTSVVKGSLMDSTLPNAHTCFLPWGFCLLPSTNHLAILSENGLFLFMCMCLLMFVHMCTVCMQCLERPEEGVRSPKSKVTSCFEPSCGCWKPNPHPLKEQ